MQPTCARDYLQAGRQRFNAAEALFRAQLTLDSCYLAGYSVECALKALIVDQTPAPERHEILRKLRSGGKWHKPENLLAELRRRDVRLPLRLARRMRKFDWTTDLRYSSGRIRTGETRGFLKTCREVVEWVEELVE